MSWKKVAVYISNIYSDMVRETVEGVVTSAQARDVKLVFFTAFTDNNSREQYVRYENYDTGDFAVFLLPELRDYDGLVTFDTYMPIMYQRPIDRLKEEAACPVVTLGTVKDSACSVVNDQDRSLREVIEHIIRIHGCRDIVHVAGKPQMTFTQERIAIFNETMAEFNLPHGEERIVYGDLNPDCGDAVVGEILRRHALSGKRRYPEAIVCANDYMAIGVCKALKDRGFRVPEDVIVTGYDDILRADFNEPSITTSAQPFRQVGQTGMDAMIRLLDGGTPEPVITVPGVLKCRQSCGCEPFHIYKKDTIREKYIATVTRLESLIQSNTNLILGAVTDETVQDIFNEIEACCLRETGFRDAVLCLVRDWDRKKIITDREAMRRERFDVVCGMYHGRPVRRGPLPEGALMPAEIMDSPEPCFIYPVHHLQYFMGYFIVSPELKNLGQLHIKSWLVSISAILENWCIRRQLTESVSELEHLYQTDMLTGLYNRRGYYRFFEAYYEECRRARTGLAVFLIDMNHMKAINDGYGHAEGDFCLCAIADAMRGCAGQDEICARSGGDEFVVLARHYTRERAEAYARAFRAAVDGAPAKAGKPYKISASVGWYLATPPEDGSADIQHEAEMYASFADKAMYEEKRRVSDRDGAGRVPGPAEQEDNC